MTKAAGPSSGATYTYRADGMRVRKVDGLTLAWIDSEESASGYYDEHQDTNHPTWRYRYDGQMCMDEDFTTGAGGGSVTGSAYGLGARSIDMIRPFTVSGGTRSYGEAQFPIYDGHGNMKATLSRSGSSPWYAISNSRSYDVWGGVRDGSSTGDPNGRYCANLGHKQDDESGLIYMRARYHEPGTGRFVSEDSAMQGPNWFVYCGNQPVNGADPSGNEWFNFGDWRIRVDGLDWHAYYKGGKDYVLSLWNDGSFKHTKDAESVAKWCARLLEDLTLAIMSGNTEAIRLGKHMVRNSFGGFNRSLRRLLRSLGHLEIVIFAYTSIEAYMQFDPEDFADTMAILGGL